MAAARWWHGQAEEWDLVLATVDGSRGAVGEVKWSGKPFGHAAIGRIVSDMEARALPPGLPEEPLRMVFVPAIGRPTPRVHHGVRILDAESVLACLR